MMGRTAELDRRIQAGPANFALLVRGGEASWTELADRLAEFEADRFILVTDGAAPADHLARVRTIAEAQAPCTVLAPSDRPAARPASDGRTVVIAIGGERACGVPADVRLPTTLAAACGPALALLRPPAGGHRAPRTAPALVWVRSDVLAGRPAPETRAGMVEVIRHVLAVCPAQYEVLAKVLRPDGRYSPQAIAACLALCADARAALVCFDPFETGPALALDYGRSLGAAVHVIAAAADAGGADVGAPGAGVAALAPGDAEALGLLLAAHIAVHRGLLDGAGAWAHHALLARNGSATALPALPVRSAGTGARTPAAVLAATAGPGLLLLAGLGHPYCARGRLLTPVDATELRAAVEGLGRTAVPHSRVPAQEPLAAATG
ncbi:hypothetical protein OG535_30845 [Kitasatospora sp. NBC_00085]|uniref:hypothetical protein n=1 Tax=Kitasatospora sp. NBC_00085 TaxID=2903566 RepID=UPI00324EBA44